MTEFPAGAADSTCGVPVTVPGVFASTQTDLGKLCQRATGHDGPHRWSGQWTGVGPAQVEADLAAEYEKWDKSDDE